MPSSAAELQGPSADRRAFGEQQSSCRQRVPTSRTWMQPECGVSELSLSRSISMAPMAGPTRSSLTCISLYCSPSPCLTDWINGRSLYLLLSHSRRPLCVNPDLYPKLSRAHRALLPSSSSPQDACLFRSSLCAADRRPSVGFSHGQVHCGTSADSRVENCPQVLHHQHGMPYFHERIPPQVRTDGLIV